MELKDDVFYVTSDGQAIHVDTIRTFVIRARDVWETLKELIKNAATELCTAMQILFRIYDSEKKIQRQLWNTPKNIMRKSQVMNRKPLVVHARSRL